MKENCFLGIDISTTSAKALLVDSHGQVTGSAAVPIESSSPQPLWSEQNPQEWWQAVKGAIQTVLAEGEMDAGLILAVGLTGQMHGLVMLDQAGQVLRPAILWNDQRTGMQCDQIRERLGKANLIDITGNDALTGFTAPKILWVQQNEPELYARCRHILLPKDYIRYCLSGEFATDKAGAAGTLLFDLEQRDWSLEVLSALDIPAAYMPKTFEGPDVTGVVSLQAAGQTGLKAGTPIVAGGGDQAAGAIGVGAVEPGVVSLVLGTSGVVFATTKEPIRDPEGLLHAFCHALPNRWHLMGVMLSAAGSLQWYRDTFQAGIPFDQLIQPAEKVPPGAAGLFFLPYLSGERVPYADPLARAGFIGLTRQHGLPEMTRALFEGVAFGLKDNMRLMQSAGLPAMQQVRISGGGAKSPLWREILANVLDTELVQVNSKEGAAFGAALLAGVSAGAWKDVPDACRTAIRIIDRTEPDRHSVEQYRKIYPLYRQLYPSLQSLFSQSAALHMQ